MPEPSGHQLYPPAVSSSQMTLRKHKIPSLAEANKGDRMAEGSGSGGAAAQPAGNTEAASGEQFKLQH